MCRENPGLSFLGRPKIDNCIAKKTQGRVSNRAKRKQRERRYEIGVPKGRIFIWKVKLMVNKHETGNDFKGTVGAKLLAEWKYRIFERRRVEERSSYEGLTEDA